MPVFCQTLIRPYIDKPRHLPKDRYPFLVIRSYLGDNGTRPPGPGPFSNEWWESPDIWYCAGPRASTPQIPTAQSCQVVEGGDYTLYAHVWNLGVLPIAGASVEFYWSTPHFYPGGGGSGIHFIGKTNVDLGPRNSSNCHSLVKCPISWHPAGGSDRHSCLIVRLYSQFGDPIGPNPWDIYQNRHVAQHNVSGILPGESIGPIIDALEKNMRIDDRIQLSQVGREAQTVLNKMKPGLKIDTTVKTHILGEIDTNRQIKINRVSTPGDVKIQGKDQKPFGAQHNVINQGKVAKPSEKPIRDLFKQASLISSSDSGKLTLIKPPQKGYALVFRIISTNEKNKQKGGYTLIIESPKSVK